MPNYNQIEKPLKSIKDLDVLDDVWILDSGNLYKGWVFDINNKHIIVTAMTTSGRYLDFRFIKTKPFNQTQLTQNHKILFLNEPCAKEISSFIQLMEDI